MSKTYLLKVYLRSGKIIFLNIVSDGDPLKTLMSGFDQKAILGIKHIDVYFENNKINTWINK